VTIEASRQASENKSNPTEVGHNDLLSNAACGASFGPSNHASSLCASKSRSMAKPATSTPVSQTFSIEKPDQARFAKYFSDTNGRIRGPHDLGDGWGHKSVVNNSSILLMSF
jgi:hypothetical protein